MRGPPFSSLHFKRSCWLWVSGKKRNMLAFKKEEKVGERSSQRLTFDLDLEGCSR
jgi:hypothetical protein